MSAAPLLRAPPFPWADAGVSGESVSSPSAAAIEEARALFADIRTARVGGCFWGVPVEAPGPWPVVLRPRDRAEMAALAGRAPDQALWLVAD